MSPRRSSTLTHQPVQRRPRTERACQFCRRAKQRCEPTEYGTNDRPCRRCVSQGLECNIPRAARSQSPSSGFGVQGPAPVPHPVAPHSAGGAGEGLTMASAANAQYTPQQSELPRVPMAGYSQLMMRSDEPQGPRSSGTISAGRTASQTLSFLPFVSSMEGYQQSFPNVAQGSAGLESAYYFGQTTSSNAYMTNYATQDAPDGATNLEYVMEESQPGNGDAFANEDDANLSRPSGS